MKRSRTLMLASSMLALFGAACVPQLNAAEPTGNEFFEKKIRPVLIAHCYECHSSKSKAVKGGLRLDTRDGLLKGGDSGPAIIPKQPNDSLLIDALRHDGLEMPPKQKLPADIIRDFEQWIAMGAPDPRTETTGGATASMDLEAGRRHWSFQPVKNVAPPAVADPSWARNTIDRFVLAGLEAKGLAPAPDAARAVLLRRVTFDLTGLPPTPDELDAFQADNEPDAFERVVDRLLGSPHFGECWGRHWLDVARFAESSGGGRSMLFPEAWRFRDYVIQSFNDDKPFDRFVTEQIAGDLLPHANSDELTEHLVATGFLVLGPHNYEEQDKSALEMDVVDEQLDTLGRAMLGLTLGCARCHDHKFDPIPTRDYYALAGIFRSTSWLEHENVSRWTERPLPVESALQARIQKHAAKIAVVEKQLATLKASLTSSEGAGSATVATTTEKDRAEVKRLTGEVAKLKDAAPYQPAAMAVAESAKMEECAIRIRGSVHSKGAVVPRGFLLVTNTAPVPPIAANQSGRRELATWLMAPSNPLTARVFVNRVWHHLFGVGIVRTVDNFGAAGEKPSHPELLDHLAVEAVRQHWSIKTMVRTLVLSHAYAQSYIENPEAAAVDPENRLLWRANRKRLPAESLRDAMLVVGGALDTRIGGSTIKGLSRSKTSGEPSKEYDYVFDDHRRSVYTPVLRNKLPELFEAFDFSDPNQSLGARNTSTTASQALVLMNGAFIIDQARTAGKKLAAIPEISGKDRIVIAYRTALGRFPSEREMTVVNEAFLRAAVAIPTNNPSLAWERLFQALFASMEFRHIE